MRWSICPASTWSSWSDGTVLCPPPRHSPVAAGLLTALRKAHAVGLIHRDIKPGNVITGKRGSITDVAKLLDFGLVQAQGVRADEQKVDSGKGVIAGTPAFHVAGAGRRPRGLGCSQRPVQSGGGGVLPADRPTALRPGHGDAGDRGTPFQSRVPSGWPSTRRAGRPPSCHSEVSGERPNSAVSKCGQPRQSIRTL